MLSLQICLINIFSILYIIYIIYQQSVLVLILPILTLVGGTSVEEGPKRLKKFWFCKIISLSFFLFVLLSIPFFNFLPFPSFFRIYNFLILFLFTHSIFNNLASSFLFPSYLFPFPPFLFPFPPFSLSFFLSFLLFHSNNYKPQPPHYFVIVYLT